MCTSGKGTWPKKALRASHKSTVESLPMDQSMTNDLNSRYASRKIYTLCDSKASNLSIVLFIPSHLKGSKVAPAFSEEGRCYLYFLCKPHSFCSGCSHHQRPARMSSPGLMARVQGAQLMLTKPLACKGLTSTLFFLI